MKKVVASLGIVSVGALTLLSASPVMAAANNSQDVAALQARVAKMEATLAKITNNSKGNANMSHDWYNRITVGGGADIQMNFGNVGGSSATSPTSVGGFTGYNSNRMSLNDAYLVFGAAINDWTTARVSVTYQDTSSNYNYAGFGHNGTDKTIVDQAYVTIANFNKMPYFLRVGQQYMPYGHYDLHPMTQTMTQVLTEVDATGATAGWMGVNGLSVTAFGFENAMAPANSANSAATNRKPINFGLSAGYTSMAGQFNYYVNAGYLYNMAGLDALQRNYVFNQNAGVYKNRNSAYTIDAGVSTGPYSVNASFASAMGSFSNMYYESGEKAQPSAYNLNANYKFNMMNYMSKATLGYEHSSQASIVGLPRYRWYAGYCMNLFKNTQLGAQYSYVQGYGTSYYVPGSAVTNYSSNNKSYNLFTVRLSVGF